MFVENNIYKTGSRAGIGGIGRGGLSGLSSRQQVLFLMQKTQKEANWNMENDSDFQEEYSHDDFASGNLRGRNNNNSRSIGAGGSIAGDSMIGSGFGQSHEPPHLIGASDNILGDQSRKRTGGGRRGTSAHEYGASGQQAGVLTYNDEFEAKRELLRKNEVKNNLIRYRLLAYSLTQFNPIKKNKYLERKRYVLSDREAQNLVCTCEKATGRRNDDRGNHHQSFNCGDSCLNRVVSAECCPWTCPCGPFCKNRRFQLHQDAYVYPVKTEYKGWGLLAGEYIRKGTFIMQYVGEVFSVDTELGEERVKRYKNSTCTYLMKTTNNEVIDPTYQGNIARFINHSCDPNCDTQKWNVLGEVCVGIFARRDIKENEELTFDYQFDFFKTPFTKCYCGAAKCKGYLGVLATNIPCDSLSKSNLSAISAPECGYCRKLILDRDSLILCRGHNKETYHIPCVIKREAGKNKTKIQAYSKNLDAKNFTCRVCRLIERKKNREDKDLLMYPMNSANMSDHQFNLNQDSEMTEEMPSDTLALPAPTPTSHLPWDSSNPEVRKYYEKSEDNRILDEIILKEIDSLEKEVETSRQSITLKKKSRQNQEFSAYYNFMTDLQKKLKQRIKTAPGVATTSNKKGMQFRRHKEMVFKNKKKVTALLTQRRESMELIKNATRRNAALSKTKQNDIDSVTVNYRCGRGIRSDKLPTKIQKSLSDHEMDNQDATKIEDKLFTKQEQINCEESLVDQEGQIASQTLMISKDNSKQLDHDQEIKMRSPQELSQQQQIEIDIDENEESDHEEEVGDEEGGESDLEQEDDESGELLDLESQIEDDEQQHSSQESLEQEEYSESIDEEDEDEEDSSNDESEESNEMEESDELNLEQLQESQDEGEKQHQADSEERVKRGGRGRGRLIKTKFINQDDSKMRQDESVSPKKSSIHHRSLTIQSYPSDPVSMQINELQKIHSLVQQRIEAFVKEQNFMLEAKLEDAQETRETRINVYDTVFNLAVPDFIEDYQCLPNFQIYWDQIWGGMVTVKFVSTFKQYNFFTQMIQWLTDLLMKSNLLSGRQPEGHHNNSSNNVMSGPQPPSQYPFEILVISVPKNYIRKLAGYQEKNLAQYRKHYSVDFDFNRDLLNDEVYPLNETTQLRVFGNALHARLVNEHIQKNLESIQMKTIFLQMSDCKVIMDHVKEVKVQVDPCEIRIKKMTREWKELHHPFYYLPNYFREMVLIGSSKEIDNAEKVLEKFLKIKRELQKINLQQISYLLPIQFKAHNYVIKQELIKKFGQHLQVFFYEPTFPRKHMTVLLIGDWKMLLEAKKVLVSEVNKFIQAAGSIERSFENFQQYTYHQQIRFSFKSLKRFVLEHDIKYLNHWDMVSEFIENLGTRKPPVLPVANSKNSLEIEEMKRHEAEFQTEVNAFIKYVREEDVETCINSLFVLTNSKPEILERLMKCFQVKKKNLIEMMMHVLKENYQAYNDALTFGSKPSFYKPFYNPGQPYWMQHQNPGSQSFYKPETSQIHISHPSSLMHASSALLTSSDKGVYPQQMMKKPSKSRSRSSSHYLSKSYKEPILRSYQRDELQPTELRHPIVEEKMQFSKIPSKPTRDEMSQQYSHYNPQYKKSHKQSSPRSSSQDSSSSLQSSSRHQTSKREYDHDYYKRKHRSSKFDQPHSSYYSRHHHRESGRKRHRSKSSSSSSLSSSHRRSKDRKQHNHHYTSSRHYHHTRRSPSHREYSRSHHHHHQQYLEKGSNHINQEAQWPPRSEQQQQVSQITTAQEIQVDSPNEVYHMPPPQISQGQQKMSKFDLRPEQMQQQMLNNPALRPFNYQPTNNQGWGESRESTNRQESRSPGRDHGVAASYHSQRSVYPYHHQYEERKHSSSKRGDYHHGDTSRSKHHHYRSRSKHRKSRSRSQSSSSSRYHHHHSRYSQRGSSTNRGSGRYSQRPHEYEKKRSHHNHHDQSRRSRSGSSSDSYKSGLRSFYHYKKHHDEYRPTFRHRDEERQTDHPKYSHYDKRRDAVHSSSKDRKPPSSFNQYQKEKSNQELERHASGRSGIMSPPQLHGSHHYYSRPASFKLAPSESNHLSHHSSRYHSPSRLSQNHASLRGQPASARLSPPGAPLYLGRTQSAQVAPPHQQQQHSSSASHSQFQQLSLRHQHSSGGRKTQQDHNE